MTQVQSRPSLRFGEVLGLVPKKPPKYTIGQFTVLKTHPDGWWWQVIDVWLTKPRKSPAPVWRYRLSATRDYDGKVVEQDLPEYRLRLAPEEL